MAIVNGEVDGDITAGLTISRGPDVATVTDSASGKALGRISVPK